MLKGIKFGVTAIQSGQKSSVVNATPQLEVKSTAGQFMITAPVSKALGIAAGENVMFGNNIANIEQALQNPTREMREYAVEQGWDLNTREGADAFIKDQTCYFIAKGVALYNKKGEPVMSTVRISGDDKKAYVDAHAAELVAAMSDEEKEAFAASKGLEEYDDESLAAAFTVDDVEWPSYHSASGAKTATSSQATGTGLKLTFTDTAIWNAMKADLEDKSSVNRVFDVKLDEPVPSTYHNGKEYVDVVYYPLVFVEDIAPVSRVGGGSEE